MTLVVIHDNERILLGLKKRGFGMGKWNGFGGKIKAGERAMDAARREVLEECGLTIEKLEPRGSLTFTFSDNDDMPKVALFVARAYQGEIIESDEMRPQWFALDKIPYENMWADDKIWLPRVLAGESVQGKFEFSPTKTILRYHLQAS